jgi:energy-coupling factor transport system ATP-binding protein
MDSVIQVNNVSFWYPPGEGEEPRLVLKNIDFSVSRGEFVAVLGHNGSGKSTLAKLLNCILLPQRGSVYVCGLDTSLEENILDIRQQVGMVFQNPDNQLVANIVEEDVAFAPENLGVPQPEIRARVDQALQTVGMYDFRQHSTAQLSGGQKQRVAIAGILAMMPQCIVMDEPTAMLDPSGRREVMKTVRQLNRENGMTVVLITHYMDEAVQADRVAVMNEGVIAMQGTPREIFTQVEELKELGLDVPQATELAFELHKAGVDIRTDVIDDQECARQLASLLKGGASS